MSLALQITILITLAVLIRRMDAIRHQLDGLDRRFAQAFHRLSRQDAPVGAVDPPTPESGQSEAGERTRGERDAPAQTVLEVALPHPVEAMADIAAADMADTGAAFESEAEAAASPPASPRPGTPDLSEPALSPPRIDLEFRFGRRWAALLGGGLVAFGLALLVRQSIQQGYFPPAVRLAGAALLSLVLCATAEVFRRRRTFATPAEASLVRRAADIPSVLLGTGLGGLFAVTYAAHAVYGFVAVGPAFAIMVMAALSGIAASLAYGPALAVLGYLAAQAVPLLVGNAGTTTGAAYVALVGMAGYAAAQIGRWRRLENPAGLVLLLWAGLLGQGPLLRLALVALPASAAALAFTVLRLQPRAAWSDWRRSWQACAALALAGGQGLLLASHVDRITGAVVYSPPATALGLAVLLSAFAFSATASRSRLMAPLLAAAIACVVATLGIEATGISPIDGRILFGPSPLRLATTFGVVSALVVAIAAGALHRGSRRAPLTGLVGAASAAALLAASDLAMHRTGGLDREILAGLAAAQGAALIMVARPRRGTVVPARAFATAAAASVGIGLLGSAVLLALGDGPLTALILALTGAGAAALAWAWAMPLFATVAGIAGLPVLLRGGVGLVHDALASGHGGAALWPLLETTLLPCLVLAGTVLALRRHPGMEAVREADRRWLSLTGVTAPAAGAGRPAVSLVLAGTASGSLLLAALVGTVRFVAYGDPYAPVSAPADLGLACTLCLSAAATALRLHRAASVEVLRQAASSLILAALALSGAAILANPFVTGSFVGKLPLLNLLVLAYLLPGLAAWRLAREERDAPRDGSWRGSAATMTITGLLAYATFAVAQAFQGPVLSLAKTTEAELWTYTAVWLAVGAVVLAYGIRFGLRTVRVAALGLLAATAAKVVFVDLSNLTGTARAASVLVLGLVLLGVGMAYQRITAATERQ